MKKSLLKIHSGDPKASIESFSKSWRIEDPLTKGKYSEGTYQEF